MPASSAMSCMRAPSSPFEGNIFCRGKNPLLGTFVYLHFNHKNLTKWLTKVIRHWIPAFKIFSALFPCCFSCRLIRHHALLMIAGMWENKTGNVLLHKGATQGMLNSGLLPGHPNKKPTLKTLLTMLSGYAAEHCIFYLHKKQRCMRKHFNQLMIISRSHLIHCNVKASPIRKMDFETLTPFQRLSFQNTS